MRCGSAIKKLNASKDLGIRQKEIERAQAAGIYTPPPLGGVEFEGSGAGRPDKIGENLKKAEIALQRQIRTNKVIAAIAARGYGPTA